MKQNQIAKEWYNALTLSERIYLVNKYNFQHAKNYKPSNQVKIRIAKWKKQPHFAKDSHNFQKRLESIGITERELQYLLSEDVILNLCTISYFPEWLQVLIETFKNPGFKTMRFISKNRSENKSLEFINLVIPIIEYGYNKLVNAVSEIIQKHPVLQLKIENLHDIYQSNLLNHLIVMLNRTMVLELNIARLQGILKGDTPEKRFDNFIHYICNNKTQLDILKKYPVLARQIVAFVNNWVSYLTEFISHLYDDWNCIKKCFFPDTRPGSLINIIRNAGDLHHDGRSVMIVQFESGLKLVYKPRSISIDSHFQNLLLWLNNHGATPPFYILNILEKKEYGWMEYIPYKDCSCRQEVIRFYKRLGGYLAVLYMLEATDFHFGNLIAYGEHPVFVDLESLFHVNISEDLDNQATFTIHHNMEQSVLKVGLLPQRVWTTAVFEGIDISGINEAEGQLWPDQMPHVENTGTDEMYYSRRRPEIIGGQNKPKLNGRFIDPKEYQEAMTDGFTKIYMLLSANKKRLLIRESPIIDFIHDKIRIILRPTRVYGFLLSESYHPDLLHNALDRTRYFDRLWYGIEKNPMLEKIIPAECKSMAKDDIPIFSTYINSRDLWVGETKCLKNFFSESGINKVLKRIRNLDRSDFNYQLWFIRSSFATLSKHINSSQRFKFLRPPVSMPFVSRKQLKAGMQKIASEIGTKISKIAFHYNNKASWLGLSMLNNQYWHITPLSYDLYAGLPGIILFLSYLDKINKNHRYIQLAKAALVTVKELIKQQDMAFLSIGVFTGLAGFIYMLLHLSCLWREQKLLDEALLKVKQIPSLLKQDNQYDIIGGSAGCIACLLSLYHCIPSRIIIDIAILCGDWLLAHKSKMKSGIGWKPSFADKPLTGFAHGAAGIAWALFNLFLITHEKRFKEAAFDAIAYERSNYLPHQKNWADLRISPATRKNSSTFNKKSLTTAWCTGATGIGLSRLIMMKYLKDHRYQEEIDVALETTINNGFHFNHSLCHGDLGNIEFLIQLRNITNDSKLTKKIDRLSHMIYNSIQHYGWRCGVELDVETPGLMNGLAGIGYGLLRLADPATIPSILTLEPPVVQGY